MKIRILVPAVVPSLRHGRLMVRHMGSRLCVVTLYCGLVSANYKSADNEYANSPVCWKQRTGN